MRAVETGEYRSIQSSFRRKGDIPEGSSTGERCITAVLPEVVGSTLGLAILTGLGLAIGVAVFRKLSR